MAEESQTTNDDGNKTKQVVADEETSPPLKRHIIAQWQVPIRGKLYEIAFEHGTTSGKRVLLIDGQEIFRRDWMFKLVGDDEFLLDGVRCIISVNPASGLKFHYSLLVDGKPYEQFKQRQAKVLKTWETTIAQHYYRVVLEKDTLNVFLNGEVRDEEGIFVNGGTDTQFNDNGNAFRLCARTSGNSREGLVYTLQVNGVEVPENFVD